MIEPRTQDSLRDIVGLNTKPETQVAVLEQRHLEADELGTALSAAQKHFEIQIAQSYRFRCLICNFEWATWRKPSITLSFVRYRAMSQLSTQTCAGFPNRVESLAGRSNSSRRGQAGAAIATFLLSNTRV